MKRIAIAVVLLISAAFACAADTGVGNTLTPALQWRTVQTAGVGLSNNAQTGDYRLGDATKYAWLWVYEKDGTIYWMAPIWTNTDGAVWWGTGEEGKEVLRNPLERLSVVQTSRNTESFAYFTSGTENWNRGLYDQAITDYTQAIRLDSSFGNAYYNRGIAYDRKKDYRRAIADYTKAIKYYPKHGYVDPHYVYLYYNRGLAYYNKRDYTRAIADWTQVTRLAPHYVDSYNNRGNAYLKQRDYDRAIADLTLTIRLDPLSISTYNNRGTAYYYKRDYTRAQADWTKALQLDPTNAIAQENLELLK
jgi:tetratricopeptide (TPR) repeat protein